LTSLKKEYSIVRYDPTDDGSTGRAIQAMNTLGSTGYTLAVTDSVIVGVVVLQILIFEKVVA
jgi:hypothetical protein